MTPRLHLPSTIVAACWFGSLCVIGFMAVPLVFATITPVAAAGHLAARLFAAQGWVAIVCTLLLLMLLRGGLHPYAEAESDVPPGTTAVNRPDMTYFSALVTSLLLALLLQLVVAPRIELRQNLALWHSAGTALYVGQWLCALVAVIRLALFKGR